MKQVRNLAFEDLKDVISTSIVFIDTYLLCSYCLLGIQKNHVTQNFKCGHLDNFIIYNNLLFNSNIRIIYVFISWNIPWFIC